jgi:mannose-6-phosphate isomerase-like protein (cupin superfamily)
MFNLEAETLRMTPDAGSKKHKMDILLTTPRSQLAVVAVPPGCEIPVEVHTGDQFVRVEAGRAEVTNADTGVKCVLVAGDAVVIGEGTKHIITALGTEALKFYTVYTPPQH